MTPPFRQEYLWEAVRSAKAVAKVMFTMGDGLVGSAPSVGTRQEVKSVADIVGSVYPTSNRVIQGWVAAVSETPKIQLTERDPSYHAAITLLPAQDVAAAHPDFKATRFQLETDCPVEACDLVVEAPAGRFAKVPMAQLTVGASFSTGGAILTIETNSPPDTAGLKGNAQVKIAAMIAKGYAFAFPVLSIFGVVGLAVATFFRKRPLIPASLLALGLGSFAAVVTRIALLAYIDASSIPVATLRYTAPASPFVIIFTVVGIFAGCVVASAREAAGQ